MDVLPMKKNNLNIDLALLTQEVKALAQEAGAFIRNERLHFDRSRVQQKGAHDYVSYVDKQCEEFLVSHLRELLPEAGFVTEEGSAASQGEALSWVIDPLDGTTNFIHDHCPYCISIALRSANDTYIGVVYEICRDEMFWTYQGAPSYLNDHVIRVSQVDRPDDAFLTFGLPYQAERYRHVVDHLIHHCYGKVGGIRIVGAAAAELCYLAAGRVDARIEAFLGPWDVAAGILIVRNAGGVITDFTGGDGYINGNQVVATNGKLHDFLLQMVQNS